MLFGRVIGIGNKYFVFFQQKAQIRANAELFVKLISALIGQTQPVLEGDSSNNSLSLHHSLLTSNLSSSMSSLSMSTGFPPIDSEPNESLLGVRAPAVSATAQPIRCQRTGAWEAWSGTAPRTRTAGNTGQHKVVWITDRCYMLSCWWA